MTQSRIPLVTDPPPEAREVLERTPLRDGAPLNIFGALAHHPRLLRRFSAMGGELLQSGLLPPRDREIVVLRVGWRRGSVYEFGQHTLIGAAAGLAAGEIDALATHDAAGASWSESDRLCIEAADQLCATGDVSDDTWARLAAGYDTAQLVELLLLAGFYIMVSGFLRSTRVPLDDGVPGWPKGTTPA